MINSSIPSFWYESTIHTDPYTDSLEFFVENNIVLNENLFTKLQKAFQNSERAEKKREAADKQRAESITDIDKLEKIAVVYVRYRQAIINSFDKYIAVDCKIVDDALKNPDYGQAILQQHDKAIEEIFYDRKKRYDAILSKSGSFAFCYYGSVQFVKCVYRLKDTDPAKYESLKKKFNKLYIECANYVKQYIRPWYTDEGKYGEYIKKTEQLCAVGGQYGNYISKCFWQDISKYIEDIKYNLSYINRVCQVPFGLAKYNGKNGNLILYTLSSKKPDTKKIMNTITKSK